MTKPLTIGDIRRALNNLAEDTPIYFGYGDTQAQSIRLECTKVNHVDLLGGNDKNNETVLVRLLAD